VWCDRLSHFYLGCQRCHGALARGTESWNELWQPTLWHRLAESSCLTDARLLSRSYACVERQRQMMNVSTAGLSKSALATAALSAVAGGGHNHCTSCHICRTSIKTSQRNYAPCSRCPAIVCRVCFDSSMVQWETCIQDRNWTCPRCNRICPCKRCRHRPDNDKHGFFLTPIVGRRGSGLNTTPIGVRGGGSMASKPQRPPSTPAETGPHFSLEPSDYASLGVLAASTSLHDTQRESSSSSSSSSSSFYSFLHVLSHLSASRYARRYTFISYLVRSWRRALVLFELSSGDGVFFWMSSTGDDCARSTTTLPFFPFLHSPLFVCRSIERVCDSRL